VRLAQNDLSLTRRELLANLNAYYRERIPRAFRSPHCGSPLTLAAESLRLTLLRYEAGEASALEVVDAQSTAADARNAG